MKIVNEQIIKEARKALARKVFYEYCTFRTPDFFKLNREYLKSICDTLQAFYESKTAKIIVINAPPRHGKSHSLCKFVEWVLGQNPEEHIMTASYNEILSTQFSRHVRDTILETKSDQKRTVYTDIFANSKIRRGDSAVKLWSLEKGRESYLATSPTGTATGFGASILVVDDLIKSAYEANNADILEKQWEWFNDTMLSRLEYGGKVVIVMTRWHTKDLAGRVLTDFKYLGSELWHLTFKAVLDDNKNMLCEEILPYSDYIFKTKTMGADVVGANYQQNPIDIKGKLYPTLKTYRNLPQFSEINCYTDTADTGADFLCAIVYGIHVSGGVKQGYILDVLYTKSGMEITEGQHAELLARNNVCASVIESNNGGRSFMRNVQRILNEKYPKCQCVLRAKTQTLNKVSRILTHSAWIMENVFFPENWRDRFPDFYTALNEYQREGKNKHDDAPDALTGVSEALATGEWIRYV
jgi:predicted phage terminase large subunit-like protein